MKIHFKIIVILFTLITGAASPQVNFYVNNMTGNDANAGLTVSSPKQTIISTLSFMNTGDIMNIAATGIYYIEHPVFTKDITVNAYEGGDVLIDLTTGDMTFNVPGTITFTAVTGGRFYFIGSATTGFYFLSGNVLLSTAPYYIQYPFLIRGEYCTSIESAPGTNTKYQLEQNYPNPFNPATRIKYSIAAENFVTLKVYNMLGEEIETLINEEKSPGNYEAFFNGKSLPSGVYIYRITAGSFTKTKKFVLMK